MKKWRKEKLISLQVFPNALQKVFSEIYKNENSVVVERFVLPDFFPKIFPFVTLSLRSIS